MSCRISTQVSPIEPHCCTLCRIFSKLVTGFGTLLQLLQDFGRFGANGSWIVAFRAGSPPRSLLSSHSVALYAAIPPTPLLSSRSVALYAEIRPHRTYRASIALHAGFPHTPQLSHAPTTRQTGDATCASPVYRNYIRRAANCCSRLQLALNSHIMTDISVQHDLRHAVCNINSAQAGRVDVGQIP